jgi:hypothetical protein
MGSRRRKHRGFVLAIVALIAITAMATAVGLRNTSARTAQGAAHTERGASAENLARSGLLRGEAYALAHIANDPDGDFDLLLDRGNDTTCTNLPLNALRSQWPGTVDPFDFTPDLADGTEVTWQNRRWTKVPFGDGAYLIRYEDDADDGINNPAYSTWTNNNAQNSCPEGPGLPSVTAVRRNNAWRDRNRTIWVIAAGISPDNIGAPKHVKVLRKLLAIVPGTPDAAMRIGGDVIANSSAEIVIRPAATGTAIQANSFQENSSAAISACGTMIASSAFPTIDEIGGDCPGNGFDPLVTDPTGSPPAVTVEHPNNAQWFDWTSHCNFYLDPNSVEEGLYFWDANGTRNGVRCDTYTGDVLTPGTDVLTLSSCWIPIMIDRGDNTEMADVCDMTELFDDGGAQLDHLGGSNKPYHWRPRNTPVDIAATNCNAYFSNDIAITKPAWGSCPDTAHGDFPYPPPAGPNPIRCSDAAPLCDGTSDTWSWEEQSPGPDDAQEFRLPSGAIWQAFVPGVYYFPSDFRVGSSDTFGPAPGSTHQSRPAMTFLVNGTFQMASSADFTTGTAVLGNGTAPFAYPSIVARGMSFNSSSDTQFAGSLYISENNWDTNSSVELYIGGLIQVVGGFTAQSSSDVYWDYPVNLISGGTTGDAPGGDVAVYPIAF